MNLKYDQEMENIKWRWIDGFTQITEMRQVMQAGIEPASDGFKLQLHGYFSGIRQTPRISIQGETIEVIQVPVNDEAIKESVDNFTDNAVRTASLSADAAALIFAHTLLDAAALDYLKVTLRVSPTEWEHHYRTKPVKLKIADIRANKLEQRISEQVTIAFKEWNNSSLPKKVDQLRIFCNSPVPYDKERLKRLDQERHGIIHGNDLRLHERSYDFDSDLNFMMHTAEYCAVVVGRKVGFFEQDFNLTKPEEYEPKEES